MNEVRKITVMNTIPPPILQMFNPALLMNAPKLGDSSENLLKEFEYIKWLFHKKTKNGKNEKKRIEGLQIISDLEEKYEWIKAKEKELEKTTTHPTKRPFYFITMLSEKDFRISKGFKYKRAPPRVSWFRNCRKIQKVR